MSKDAPATGYRFGRFELQPSERRLLSDDQPVAVGPRAFDLLVTLVERAGELVTKDELLARVWPRLVVEENNVQVQASALRRILGPKAIATVVGRGYRFTPSVEPIDAMVRSQAQFIIDTMRAKKMPTMFSFPSIAAQGALAGYGVSFRVVGKSSARYVQKIRTGTKPQDIAVESISRMELALNINTARDIGVTIPQGVRLIASEVIE